MGDQWRIREGVNQTLLLFALGAREKLVGERQVSLIHGLLQRLLCKPLEQQLPQVWNKLAKTAATNQQQCLTTLAKIPDVATKALSAAPSQIGDIVEWWILAAAAAISWRAAVCRDRARQQADRHDRRGSDGSVDRWLWRETVDRLQLDDDEEYPPLWAASHSDMWHLPDGRTALVWPESWTREARRPEDCRRAFLDWCGDPCRELKADTADADAAGVADAWVEDYAYRHRDFARAALRLLRTRCRFAAEPGPTTHTSEHANTLDRWRLAPTAQSPSNLRILRPPLVVEQSGSSELLVPGWFMSPWPAAVLEQLAAERMASDLRSPSFSRALEAARLATKADRTFAPLPPWNLDGLEGADVDRLSAGLERLVAVVRLAAIAAATTHGTAPPGSVADASPREPVLSDALAAEGFAFRRVSTQGTDGRRIPYSSAVAQADDSAAGYVLARAGSELTVDVGMVGHPSRCRDELLEAIEEFDWRWWALKALAAGCDQGGIAGKLADCVEKADWEAVKRGLLDLSREPPADAAPALADAFTAIQEIRWNIQEIRLKIKSLSDANGGESIALFLTSRLKDVADAVMRVLLSIDPQKQGGLYPPRTSESRIDLAACATGPCSTDGRWADWDVAWQKHKDRFGTHVREAREGRRLRGHFSAGDSATEADLRLLDGIDIAVGEGFPSKLLRPLRARVEASLSAGQSPDFSAAITETRTSWQAEAADAFDELIKRSLAGESKAVKLLQLLHADNRFRFACHPKISFDDQRVSLSPAAAGDTLTWRDDDAVPVDDDITVFFAIDPARACRVLSRGQPAADSAEARAARLEAALAAAPPEALVAAKELRETIDRHRLFKVDNTESLHAVLDVVAALDPSTPGDAWRATVFSELAGCCAAYGATIIPGDWSPLEGTPAEHLVTTRHGFHGSVPRGRVVVERFGVAAKDGTVLFDPDGFKSAGPEPPGYREAFAAVHAISDTGDLASRLRKSILEFPKRVENGQAQSGAAGLFDLAWKLKREVPEQADVDEAVQAVQRLLERGYEMVVFAPQKVGEVQDGWMTTTEGGEPGGSRGTRVSLVRPGVRTRDNICLCKAIVELE